MAFSLPTRAARVARLRSSYAAAAAPLLGFVVVLAVLFAASYAVGSASGPASPGWHRTDRSPASPGTGGGEPAGMSGMEGM